MANWLDRIQDPRDIRGLSIDELNEIAEDIRQRMLEVTAINGGHLASSMGTVELTLALHYVFDTPRDKLVWDVGHQAYPHKLLTGRAGRFDTIRQEGGLSGFLKRSESEYDAFGAGHASTALSAALGMAMARDQKGEDYRVISITGDGALTGGACFEAINNAGSLKTDMLMIVNDNEMSISKNVGGLSQMFNNILTTNFYNERHRDIRDFVLKLPAGQHIARFIHKVDESIKGLILPGLFFEELGCRYLGPFDGHDLESLIQLLGKIRTLPGPIIMHVVTAKGKGRPYAELDPIKYHSPPKKFDAISGIAPAVKPGPPGYSSVFVKTLADEARRDKRIVAITAAMLEGTALSNGGFQDEFPDRTVDVGIAEEHAVLAAAGMACEGLRPVVCIYSTFLQRAFDMIIHDVALQKLPVVFSLDRGGLVGDDGPTHHGVFDLSYLRMVPNLILMAASSGNELRDMTHTALHYEDGPIAFRFPRGSIIDNIEQNTEPNLIPIGTGETLREGDEVCLIGIGLTVQFAQQAAETLAAEGIKVGVINARFVKPLDEALLLEAASRYKHLVTIEDNVLMGGFGSAVLELLNREQAEVKVTRLGIPDEFIHHGKPESLYRYCGFSPEDIADTVHQLMATQKKQRHTHAKVRAVGE